MSDLRRAFGIRLRELRRERGLSQEELAGRAALHWTYLSDLERGQQSPTLDVINRIARGLNVSLAALFAPLDQPFKARMRKTRDERTPARGRRAVRKGHQ